MADTVSIAGRSVLFVMAVEAEYGPHLRALFKPLLTGVGPVEAAVAVAAALTRMADRDHPVDLVVSLGSAGSRRLEQTVVYQATAVAYRDMDASALGFPKGETPLLGLPRILDLPLRLPDVPGATLSTGGSVVSGAAYDAIAEDMVDMESYAVLRACQRAAVPLIALRGISDGKTELRHVGDWTEYLHVVDANLAAAVGRLEPAIATGALVI
ncbi:MAG: 5'-methylthioadenosine/S-adenosylhomocysteine nucleosidase [Rhizobiaceae bacterium]|nr:5'-methylthioadenosine/S-adenosylhomocysteine nucleosidase [Rhizobiaceae bacterium]